MISEIDINTGCAHNFKITPQNKVMKIAVHWQLAVTCMTLIFWGYYPDIPFGGTWILVCVLMDEAYT